MFVRLFVFVPDSCKPLVLRTEISFWFISQLTYIQLCVSTKLVEPKCSDTLKCFTSAANNRPASASDFNRFFLLNHVEMSVQQYVQNTIPDDIYMWLIPVTFHKQNH